MQEVTLYRTKYSDEFTSGYMDICGLTIYTIEKPDRDNQAWISCIPEGEYLVKPHRSKKFGRCFKLYGTEPRTDILIHTGNTAQDVSGCIAIGHTPREGAVIGSRHAMNMLLELQTESFLLNICRDVEEYP